MFLHYPSQSFSWQYLILQRPIFAPKAILYILYFRFVDFSVLDFGAQFQVVTDNYPGVAIIEQRGTQLTLESNCHAQYLLHVEFGRRLLLLFF